MQSEPPFSGENSEVGGVERALALRWFEAKRGSIQAKQFEDDYNDDDDTDDVKDIVAHASISNRISYLRVLTSMLSRVTTRARESCGPN